MATKKLTKNDIENLNEACNKYRASLSRQRTTATIAEIREAFSKKEDEIIALQMKLTQGELEL